MFPNRVQISIYIMHPTIVLRRFAFTPDLHFRLFEVYRHRERERERELERQTEKARGRVRGAIGGQKLRNQRRYAEI